MPQAMAIGDPLSQILWQAAKDYSADKNFEFTVPCEYHVKDFIEHGVSRLRILFGQDIPEDSIELSKENLIKVVSGMIAYARSHDQPQLQEESFFDTKSWICPLYPFC